MPFSVADGSGAILHRRLRPLRDFVLRVGDQDHRAAGVDAVAVVWLTSIRRRRKRCLAE
jgi:hypothetical protein